MRTSGRAGRTTVAGRRDRRCTPLRAATVCAAAAGVGLLLAGPAAAATPTDAPTYRSAVVHDGYTSVLTVNRGTGHMQESYLTAASTSWATRDLSTLAGVPGVAPGTVPVAAVHDGALSVFTVNRDHSLQETSLPALGARRQTQNLTTSYGGPTIRPSTSVSAVTHAGCTSVFGVDAAGRLTETSLSAPGERWATAVLPAPAVEDGSSPAAVVHAGVVSVFTVDTDHHLQESAVAAAGSTWAENDLTARYGVHPAATGSSPVAVADQGRTSVFTVDDDRSFLIDTSSRRLAVPRGLAGSGAPCTRWCCPLGRGPGKRCADRGVRATFGDPLRA